MMSKDPAFLFYSQDFYGGTRMMLPVERAAYIDLLICQHQNGFIPTDIERVKLYCTGIDQAVLQAVLQAKFKQTDKGWYNEKLAKTMEQRAEFKENRSTSGQLGAFFKMAKKELNASVYREFKAFVYNNGGAEFVLTLKEEHQANLQAMLQAVLKHIENENENEIENDELNSRFDSQNFKEAGTDSKQTKKKPHKFEDANPKTPLYSPKGGVVEGPSFEEWQQYWRLKGRDENHIDCENAWNYYEERGWTDKMGKKVVNWKNKMTNLSWFKECPKASFDVDSEHCKENPPKDWLDEMINKWGFSRKQAKEDWKRMRTHRIDYYNPPKINPSGL